MARPNNGPQLSDEPNEHGFYEIRWSEKGRSKRESTGERSRKEAVRYFAAWMTEKERCQSKGDRHTVNEILDFYWSGHVEEKVVDKERIKDCCKPLRAFFGDMEAAEIEPDDVDEYLRQRRAGRIGGVSEQGKAWGHRRVKDATVRRELAILAAAIHFSVKKRHSPRDSAPEIELPEDSAPRDRWLTREEADRLIAATPPELSPGQGRAARLTRCYRFVMIALNTAARRRAIEGLTWFQVDLARRLIDFRKPGERATKKRKAVVPISDELLPILERAKREATSEYVLDNPGAIRKTFDGAVRRAGLPGVHRHTLRHTWATWAAQHGVPMWEIAGVLGDTVETVTRNYLKHSPDHLRGAVNFRRPAAAAKAEEEG